MKTILIPLIALLAAFALGLAGTYVALPMVAPEVAEAFRAHPDSLATGLAETSDLTTSAEADEALNTDVLPAMLHLPEHDDDAPVAPDSTAIAGDGDALPTVQVPADSIAALQRRLEAAEARIPDLAQQVDALRAQLAASAAQRVRAQELASTLTRLEDRELAAILSQLDTDVVHQLYEEASPRNRTRLLRGLSPERAARFIQQQATTSQRAAPISAAGTVPDPAEPLAVQ